MTVHPKITPTQKTGNDIPQKHVIARFLHKIISLPKPQNQGFLLVLIHLCQFRRLVGFRVQTHLIIGLCAYTSNFKQF